MLSVHAVHFTFQSSFQAHYSTRTGMDGGSATRQDGGDIFAAASVSREPA
jgi:hypothetical protein